MRSVCVPKETEIYAKETYMHAKETNVYAKKSAGNMQRVTLPHINLNKTSSGNPRSTSNQSSKPCTANPAGQ